MTRQRAHAAGATALPTTTCRQQRRAIKSAVKSIRRRLSDIWHSVSFKTVPPANSAARYVILTALCFQFSLIAQCLSKPGAGARSSWRILRVRRATPSALSTGRKSATAAAAASEGPDQQLAPAIGVRAPHRTRSGHTRDPVPDAACARACDPGRNARRRKHQRRGRAWFRTCPRVP